MPYLGTQTCPFQERPVGHRAPRCWRGSASTIPAPVLGSGWQIRCLHQGPVVPRQGLGVCVPRRDQSLLRSWVSHRRRPRLGENQRGGPVVGWAAAGRVGDGIRTQGSLESPRDVCPMPPLPPPSLPSAPWGTGLPGAAAPASVMFSCSSGVTGRTRFWGRSPVPGFMTRAWRRGLFKQTPALPLDRPPPGSVMSRP